MCLILQLLYKIWHMPVLVSFWHSFMSISWDRNIRWMSYRNRSKPEIFRFHPITPFYFSFTVPIRQQIFKVHLLLTCSLFILLLTLKLIRMICIFLCWNNICVLFSTLLFTLDLITLNFLTQKYSFLSEFSKLELFNFKEHFSSNWFSKKDWNKPSGKKIVF